MAASAAGLDGARRPMLDEGFGDLGAGAVAGAQEQQLWSSPSRLDVAGWRRHERQPGMERAPGFGE
jgi:hypothetical protein